MKRKKLLIIGVALIIVYIFSHLYKKFFTNEMIVGTYVNRNYKSSPIAPNLPDTIKLLENNQFASPYWKKGTYEISYSLKGTNIDLHFENKKEGYYSTYITRIWYGKPKIIVFMDLRHYYEKSD